MEGPFKRQAKGGEKEGRKYMFKGKHGSWVFILMTQKINLLYNLTS